MTILSDALATRSCFLSITALLAACSLCSCFGGGRDSSESGGGSARGVSIADSCTPPPDCGGDPTGTWEVMGGCAEAPPMGFECAEGVNGGGTASGSYTIGETGYDYDLDTELRQCGWIDSGGEGSSGSLVIDGNTLQLGGDRSLTFCVEGDTLWLYEPARHYPDLTVMRLERRLQDAGTP